MKSKFLYHNNIIRYDDSKRYAKDDTVSMVSDVVCTHKKNTFYQCCINYYKSEEFYGEFSICLILTSSAPICSASSIVSGSLTFLLSGRVVVIAAATSAVTPNKIMVTYPPKNSAWKNTKNNLLYKRKYNFILRETTYSYMPLVVTHVVPYIQFFSRGFKTNLTQGYTEYIGIL